MKNSRDKFNGGETKIMQIIQYVKIVLLSEIRNYRIRLIVNYQNEGFANNRLMGFAFLVKYT